ncbi:VOC family protein [Erythrobacter sp. F6033]|uniref:VOC family protein n=1 Tax=Erythrobacter sp. F6033 TaxID=2926401 RepID=UPI001FF45C91|nr:VOC family protein [Erythrobacter sp. F6033]MCK0129245.1 VOC family protein [Erythrobacter sp. F6033]
MSVITIEDIAHVRFAAPDLTKMQAFLTDFGLENWMDNDGFLYGKGSDGAPFSHSTEQGSAGFRGLGLRANSIEELERLAQHENVPVQALEAPGGGHVVRLQDPDGFCVEVVSGQSFSSVQHLSEGPARNSAAHKARLRSAVRLKPGPSHVRRLGHCVLNVSDFRTSERWYKDRFGFITSDEIEASSGTAIGAFMRCDRGDQPTDHHTLFLTQLPEKPGFMHAAFEVACLDDLMLGHAHLKAQKRQAAWGIGRHVLGSQIFDYWKDPWGHELEHWTDGDLFTASDGSNTATVDDLLSVQWGMPNPVFAGALRPSPGVLSFVLSLNAKLRSFFRRSSAQSQNNRA